MNTPITALDECLKIYNELGFISFPCPLGWDHNKKKKIPNSPKGWSSFTASVPLGSVTDFSIQTGKRSNIIVLDLDTNEDPKKDGVKKWRKIQMANGEAVDTFTVKTPSGGKHLYFKYNTKLKVKSSTDVITWKGIKLSIDLRSDGGMVFAAGSIYPDPDNRTPYAIIKNKEPIEMPDWLIDLINGETRETKEEPVIPTLKMGERKEIMTILEGRLKLLPQSCWNDDYNTWLNLGMAIHNLTTQWGCPNPGLDLWKEFSEDYKDYTESVLDDKWESFNSTRTNRYGWPFILKLCREHNSLELELLMISERINKDSRVEEIIYNLDNPKTGNDMIDDKVDMRTQGLISESAFQRTYWVTLFNEAPNCKAKAEVSHKFMKHFVNIILAGKERCFYRITNTFGNLIWEESSSADLEGAFKSHKFKGDDGCINLYSTQRAIQADTLVIDPSHPVLFRDPNMGVCLNTYIAPEWNLKKLNEWYEEHGDEETKDILYKNIEYHLKDVICGGNETDAKWLHDWIGNALFNPLFAPLCCPILMSQHTGTGKSSFVNKIFENYMGPAYSVKDDSKFEGNGSLTSIIGKTLCLLDELCITSTENYNKWKTLISQDKITFEQKYVNSREVRNICKFIATSNLMNPIGCLIPGERRAVFFSLNSAKTLGQNYFDFIVDSDWHYWPLYFAQYEDRKGWDKHRTYQNQVQAEIRMSPIDEFIREKIIWEYNQLITNKDGWISTKYICDMYFEYHENKWPGQKVSRKTPVILEKLKSSSVWCGYKDEGKAVRRMIDGSSVMAMHLNKREIIVETFKRFHSNLDPLVDDCSCGGARGVYHCEEDDVNVCNKCIDKYSGHRLTQM